MAPPGSPNAFRAGYDDDSFGGRVMPAAQRDAHGLKTDGFGIHDTDLSLNESDIANIFMGRQANEFMLGGGAEEQALRQGEGTC